MVIESGSKGGAITLKGVREKISCAPRYMSAGLGEKGKQSGSKGGAITLKGCGKRLRALHAI